MTRWPYAVCALLALLLVQTGCSSSVLQLRDQLDLHFGGYRQKFDDKKELVTKFLACTRQAHDEPLNERRDPSASPDPLSLQSPEGQATSVRPLMSLIDRVRWRHQGKDASLYILADVLDDVANDANARIDLDKLKQVVEIVRQWHGHLGLDEDQLEQDASRFARTLLAYNKAYFGDLSFTARSDYAGAGLRGVVKITSKGFVDRSGNALLFPGISAELEVSPANSVRMSAGTVDSQRVSADLMRIFLEAFFDAAYRVPAVHGATALQVGPDSLESPYPEFDANRPMISLEALARVTRDALRAEAAVTSFVGKAVRGGSVFSAQNETLAATLETAAGVIAKKLVEHEGFCYFQVTEGKPAIAANDQAGAEYVPVATP
ncbi:MAG: hypothetical protein CAF43_005705 [Nitrospira sp. CG24C]|jgi:hypothetical protein|nr:MAG: hypothetical protein CAF43_005705 [Nitrospira sp. CG24C]